VAARDFLPDDPSQFKSDMERCLASPRGLDYVVYQGEVPFGTGAENAGAPDGGRTLPAYFISVRRNWARCSDGGVFGAVDDYARYIFTQDGVLLRTLGPGQD
jgi:hypothetical protein